MAEHDSPDLRPDTALDAALSRIGDRWSLLVVAALLDGPRRFGELETAVVGIATNVLTHRLRSLEAGGVIVAQPYSRRPLRCAYALTATGHELAGALRLLSRWGAEAAGPGTTTPTHRSCGTELEVRWWCHTCDLPVDQGREMGEGPLLWV